MKKPTKLQLLLIVLIIAVLSFIWTRSLKSIPDSREESLGILAWLNSIQHFIVFKHTVVRKIAHIIEFGTLSTLVTWLIYTITTKKIFGLLSVNIGFFVALIDETIQIFSKRGPLISDIWIDSIGTTLGFIFVFIIFSIYTKNHTS